MLVTAARASRGLSNHQLSLQWDEAKYPPRRPLKETVEAITDIVTQLEDQLKVRHALRRLVAGTAHARRRRFGT